MWEIPVLTIILGGIDIAEKTNSRQVQTSAHIRCMLFCVMIAMPTMVYAVQAKQVDAG